MNPEETMVENEFDDEVVDDALPDGVVEDTDESEEDLESFLDDEASEEEEPADEPKDEPAQQASEPGWIKKRVEKAVTRAVAETEARMQAMFDQQMAPIRAKMMEDEAQELLRSRKVSDIETARELVRLRNGQPAQQVKQQPAQPRNSNGQFAPRVDTEAVKTDARIDMLRHQADRIKAAGGPDVIAEFQDNEEIKRKVIAGEMDFHDVADYMRKQQHGRRPPSPMRSPNGANGTPAIDFASMSDKQFERIEKRIQEEGVRYRLR